ncbi:hypothetical protein H700_11091 [Staphylococcus epidermidis 41tr]|nr:hypothetical protein H700_11091 [Staphylococcus epidermidis 41tr]
MYHHIQMYLEQLGYDIVEVILLFEKVDQNHADMDELNTLNQLASAVIFTARDTTYWHIHIHLHHSIPMNSSNGLFSKVMIVISLRYRIGTFLFIIVHHIIAGIYSNSLIVIEPPNP